MRHQVLGDSLAEKIGVPSSDVLQGKGGFWIRQRGFYTLAQARQITGLTATPRPRTTRVGPWGDWAVVAMLNHGLASGKEVE